MSAAPALQFVALLEVADKIPHPELLPWIVTHVVLSVVTSIAVRVVPRSRRLLFAAAFAWMALVAAWSTSYVVTRDPIASDFAREVGLGYLLAVVVIASLPALISIWASRRQRSLRDPAR